jgi:hypothetical protein
VFYWKKGKKNSEGECHYSICATFFYFSDNR